MPLERIAKLQAIIERMLYVTLLLVVIGVGVVIYIAISFGHTLEDQVKEAQKISVQNQKLSNQLQKSVNALQKSNDQQTAYIQCLLAASNVTISDSMPPCTKPSNTPISVPLESFTQPQSSISRTAPPSQSSQSSTPTTSPNPQPSPAPSPAQRALDFVHKLTGGLL